jgi:4-hydroxy-tetrahydrodipicolinate synthase
MTKDARALFTGCGTALVTPFKKDGSVDEAGVRRLVRRQIDLGIHFLVPCGTTGESPTLSEDERVRIVEIAVDESARRVPVLAGAGGYDTREVIHVGKRMRDAGANGVLSVTPYYNKPTPEGLYQHYRAIAGEVGLPVIVYVVPGRTGLNVEPPTLARLATISGIAGVKEASGNMSQICEVCRIAPPDFVVLSGDDALTLPVMSVGGRGIISVASNGVPAELSKMVELAEADHFADARRIHASLMPFLTVNFGEATPIPIKAAMAMMGLLEEHYRLPMVPPQPASREKIAAVLQSMNLLPAAAR